jgi:hypothetical protein
MCFFARTGAQNKEACSVPVPETRLSPARFGYNTSARSGDLAGRFRTDEITPHHQSVRSFGGYFVCPEFLKAAYILRNAERRLPYHPTTIGSLSFELSFRGQEDVKKSILKSAVDSA